MAAGGDPDQAGDDARGGTQRGGVAVADAFHDRPADHRRSGGGHGVDEGDRGGVVGRQCGAGVEAEPADEQQRGPPGHHQRQIVRTHRLLGEALRLPRTRIRASAAAPALMWMAVPPAKSNALSWLAIQPPTVEPSSAENAKTQCATGEVDHQRPHHHERDPGGELHPVGDRTGDQRRCDDREGRLEGDEGEGRNQMPFGPGGLVGTHQAGQPDQLAAGLEGIADDPGAAGGVAEGQAVTDDDPQRAHHGHRHEAHHHHVEYAFGAGHATVEQSQGGHGHHQNECCTDQHPGGIAGIEVSRSHGQNSPPRLRLRPGCCAVTAALGGSPAICRAGFVPCRAGRRW